MSKHLHAFVLLLHLLSVIVWLGGMFFAHVCLRPAAQASLEPPQRIPLMAATLRRFFAVVSLAAPVAVISGAIMMTAVGLKAAPIGWHLMMLLGLVMALIFAFIRWVPYPQLQRASGASSWPQAAAALARIRHWVLVNLVLGGLTVVCAVMLR